MSIKFSVIKDTETSEVFGILVNSFSGAQAFAVNDKALAWENWVSDSKATFDEAKDFLDSHLQNEHSFEVNDEGIKKLKEIVPADVVEKVFNLSDDRCLFEINNKSSNYSRHYVSKGVLRKSFLSENIHARPIPINDLTQRQIIIDYKAELFRTQSNIAALNIQGKAVRAVFDRNVGPGGGWRCPEGTLYGGRITDRFGRGCGGSLTRRIGSALQRAGQGLTDAATGREDRRMQRVERRARARGERRERVDQRRENLAQRLELAADRLVGDFNPPATDRQRENRRRIVEERAPDVVPEERVDADETVDELFDELERPVPAPSEGEDDQRIILDESALTSEERGRPQPEPEISERETPDSESTTPDPLDFIEDAKTRSRVEAAIDSFIDDVQRALDPDGNEDLDGNALRDRIKEGLANTNLVLQGMRDNRRLRRRAGQRQREMEQEAWREFFRGVLSDTVQRYQRSSTGRNLSNEQISDIEEAADTADQIINTPSPEDPRRIPISDDNGRPRYVDAETGEIVYLDEEDELFDELERPVGDGDDDEGRIVLAGDDDREADEPDEQPAPSEEPEADASEETPAPPAKKSPAKKSPAKKSPAKKSAARKARARRRNENQGRLFTTEEPPPDDGAPAVPPDSSTPPRTPAKKSPAKKSPAKKSPAKKSPAKKSPAKKSPARSVRTGFRDERDPQTDSIDEILFDILSDVRERDGDRFLVDNYEEALDSLAIQYINNPADASPNLKRLNEFIDPILKDLEFLRRILAEKEDLSPEEAEKIRTAINNGYRILNGPFAKKTNFGDNRQFRAMLSLAGRDGDDDEVYAGIFHPIFRSQRDELIKTHFATRGLIHESVNNTDYREAVNEIQDVLEGAESIAAGVKEELKQNRSIVDAASNFVAGTRATEDFTPEELFRYGLWHVQNYSTRDQNQMLSDLTPFKDVETINEVQNLLDELQGAEKTLEESIQNFEIENWQEHVNNLQTWRGTILDRLSQPSLVAFSTMENDDRDLSIAQEGLRSSLITGVNRSLIADILPLQMEDADFFEAWPSRAQLSTYLQDLTSYTDYLRAIGSDIDSAFQTNFDVSDNIDNLEDLARTQRLVSAIRDGNWNEVWNNLPQSIPPPNERVARPLISEIGFAYRGQAGNQMQDLDRRLTAALAGAGARNLSNTGGNNQPLTLSPRPNLPGGGQVSDRDTIQTPSDYLDANMLRKARRWTEALRTRRDRRRSSVAAAIQKKYGNSSPWEDSNINLSADTVDDLLRRRQDAARAGNQNVVDAVEAEVKDLMKRMYEVELELPDGQIMFSEVTGLYLDEDFIKVDTTIYAWDGVDNKYGNRVGNSVRRVYPSQKTISSSSLFITNRNYKKNGFATLYNQNSWTWAKHAGYERVQVSAADDGPYAWPKVGYKSGFQGHPQLLYNTFTDQLLAYRNGRDSIIKDADQAELVEYLLQRAEDNNYSVSFAPSHGDYIVALTGGKSISEARNAELKDFFMNTRGIRFDSGTLDLTDNSLVPWDPRNPNKKVKSVSDPKPIPRNLDNYRRNAAPHLRGNEPRIFDTYSTDGGLPSLTASVLDPGDVPKPLNIVNANIRDSDEAVLHLERGGDLNAVPQEFWRDALTRVRDRFEFIIPGGVNNSRIFLYRNRAGDNDAQVGYIIKASRGENPGANPEHVREVVATNLLVSHGITTEGGTFGVVARSIDENQGILHAILPHALNHLPVGPADRGSTYNYEPDIFADAEDGGYRAMLLNFLHNFMTGTNDRHPGNALTYTDSNGDPHVIPIDFGYRSDGRSDVMDYLLAFAMHQNLFDDHQDWVRGAPDRIDKRAHVRSMVETLDDFIARTQRVATMSEEDFIRTNVPEWIGQNLNQTAREKLISEMRYEVAVIHRSYVERAAKLRAARREIILRINNGIDPDIVPSN